MEAGTYTLIVSAAGYRKESRVITLEANQSMELTIALELVEMDLPEVSVRGFLSGGTELAARQQEKLAMHLVSIIAAEAIERSSDITVADVTQRVSGLSVLRDNTGQATKTIIRGTDPKYNYTLVNGIKIPSPDDRGRYIPLDIFPADIVQAIQVYKSLTPDLEGDAIGGGINIVLKDAPSQPVLTVKLATGYHQAFFGKPYTGFNAKETGQKSPLETYGPDYYATTRDFTRANLAFRRRHPLPNGLGNLVANRRFAHGRVGVLLAADYQASKRGSTSSFIPQVNEPQLDNRPSLTDYYQRDFSTTFLRKNFHAKMDYTPSSRHKLTLHQFWMQQREEETRFSVDTSLSQGRTIPGTGRIVLAQRARVHDQSIYSVTGQGRHQFASRLNANWSLSYSVARGAYPDWAELTATAGRLEEADHSIRPTPVLLAPLTRTWIKSKEHEASAYADLSYPLTVFQHKIVLKSGGLFRQKKRNNFLNSYTFNPAITTASGQPFTDIYHAEWAGDGPVNPLGTVANPNTYIATERIGAGYAAAEGAIHQLEWVAGARLETTHQQFRSSVDPRQSAGKQVAIWYADILPSAAIKLSVLKNDQLRLSYFRSISRPALSDVTFYTIQYEDYQEVGNPFLKRAQATNFELKYEHSPNATDFWQGSIFYKHIANPYERTLLNANDVLYPIPDHGLPYTPAGQLTAQQKNFAPATVFGTEWALSRQIGAFTVRANYTFSFSRITHIKKFKTREDPANAASNIITVDRTQVRPLQGQSAHLGNLSVAYAHPESGLKAQVTAVYTGKRIYAVSGWYNLDYWQRGYTLLDISVAKKLGMHCELFGKVNNLLNAATKVDLRVPNAGFGTAELPGQERRDFITVMKQYDKAMYHLGIQWSW